MTDSKRSRNEGRESCHTEQLLTLKTTGEQENNKSRLSSLLSLVL